MSHEGLCERFECPSKASCDEYHAQFKGKRGLPCDLEKASTCGDGRCYNCIHTDECPVVFSPDKHPTGDQINRIVCNPGHTCKDKTKSDCGYYPPFKFAHCKQFRDNCKREFTPRMCKTTDGKHGLMFITFIIPVEVLDAYIDHIATRLRKTYRGEMKTVREVWREEKERDRLHRMVMDYFPGWAYDVGVISSAFRYAVEGYVEDSLRKRGLLE